MNLTRLVRTGTVSAAWVGLLSGCEASSVAPIPEHELPASVALVRTLDGVDVPARSEASRKVSESDFVQRAIMDNGGWVRIGLKDPLAARGVWHGEWLLSKESRDAAARVIADVDSIEVVSEDAILPAVVVRVKNVGALQALRKNPNVDYISPAFHRDDAVSSMDSGCGNEPWGGGPLYQASVGGDVYSGSFNEAQVPRAWEYLNNAATGSAIGYVDTGVDQTGAWPQISAASITVVGPNNGDCSHGNRMISVTAAPRDGIGSVGVAFGNQVIASDHGGSVVPGFADVYSAIQQLYLAGGMPTASRVIIFGFGLAGEYSDVRDLIEFGYYQRGFAFFSPAGSNHPFGTVVFPAYLPEVFAVTARLSVSTCPPETPNCM